MNGRSSTAMTNVVVGGGGKTLPHPLARHPVMNNKTDYAESLRAQPSANSGRGESRGGTRRRRWGAKFATVELSRDEDSQKDIFAGGIVTAGSGSGSSAVWQRTRRATASGQKCCIAIRANGDARGRGPNAGKGGGSSPRRGKASEKETFSFAALGRIALFECARKSKQEICCQVGLL